jgi:branched-chain amino acid transport system ATP-binding protein
MTSPVEAPARRESILCLREVTLRFGGLVAIDGIDLDVEEGEILGLVGPNGAGKTSILNCVNGFYRPQKGTIRFRGPVGSAKELTKLSPHRIASLGLIRTFQNTELFRGLTVLDNVLIGRHRKMRANLITGAIPFGSVRAEERRNREIAHNILQRLGLAELEHTPASQLSVGTQKLVEVARALAAEPQIILLDEPVAGLSQAERNRIAEAIQRIHAETGVTLVVIEHDIQFVRRICQRVAVFNFGRKIADGPPAEVFAVPAVVEAFLGGSAAPAPA